MAVAPTINKTTNATTCSSCNNTKKLQKMKIKMKKKKKKLENALSTTMPVLDLGEPETPVTSISKSFCDF